MYFPLTVAILISSAIFVQLALGDEYEYVIVGSGPGGGTLA